MKNVLEYLENSADMYPDKTAAIDENGSCTYSELINQAKSVGTYLLSYASGNKPIVVFMDKSVRTLQLFMGIVYSGCFYVLVDPSFPIARIEQIFGVLKPTVVITNDANIDKLKQTSFSENIIMENDIDADIDEKRLSQIRNKACDTDALYGIFTSGSTGIPKGVVICHRSVIDFIDTFTKTFNISEKDVIGNQAPFDFDVSVKDIYSCLKVGATLVIIPKAYFMFPNAVVDMLCDNNVTTLIWAVSALCLLNRLHGLKYKVPDKIDKIMFSGEMMPIKQLNQWRAYYPNAMFVNLYGPTEITCNCTYYIIDKEYEETDKLPMGIQFDNEKVFLLDDNNKEVKEPGIAAQVCVSGTALALGYYNNKEVTDKVFVQNPLNGAYPERIYKTGDLAMYNDEGLLVFSGRKDFQIKHMGHRIELEEIDSALNSQEEIERAISFFDDKKNRIVSFYTGHEDSAGIIVHLKKVLPEFMVPNVFIHLTDMPLNKNGKIDRAFLKEQYSNGGYRGKR